MQNNNQQVGSNLPQEEALTDHLEKAVHDLMNEFDLDENQAKKLEKLEDEGYDEEDALAQVMDV